MVIINLCLNILIKITESINKKKKVTEKKDNKNEKYTN